MKYLVKFFVVTFFWLICTHTFADQKIVVLDMTYALNKSKAGKGAQEFLTKTFNDNVKKFTGMEKALKDEEKDLLAKKNIDYQTERRSAIDKITMQRAKAREALLKKLEPILQSYIEENSVSLVVDKKYTLGGGTESDITKVIVEKLNKDLPSLNLK